MSQMSLWIWNFISAFGRGEGLQKDDAAEHAFSVRPDKISCEPVLHFNIEFYEVELRWHVS